MLPNMRQIEQLFIRVNHNNGAPSYLQQLAHLTERISSTGKGFKNDVTRREHGEQEQAVSGG